MMERSLPWWRRALEFALGGIAGLFRRSGNGATKREVDAQDAAAEPETTVAPPVEEQEIEIEVQEEESRVNPSSPYSEPVHREPAAPEAELAAETIAPLVDPFDRTDAISAQEFVATPIQPVQVTTPVETAPIENASEAIAIAAEAVPEEAIAPERETAQGVDATLEEMETPLHENEPMQIAEVAPQATAVSQVESAPEEETAPEADSSGESEAAQAAEAAPEEKAIAAIEIATEAQPEEARAPELETAPGVDATLEEMETPLHENEATKIGEASPPSAPSAAAVQSASAPEPPPTSPQEIAPTLPFAEKPAGRTTAEKVAAALKAREARGEEADQSPFSVIVNQVYDGPLDLLLDLIRKQDIDIYDIPIAKITAQFLAYVDRLRASDMDVAGDFIYTAALLIHIKSKMLLPRAPAGPDDAADDPRRELVERLLEHERFKNAAQMLREKQMLESATWTNPGMREFQEDAAAEPEIAADTTDLVRVFSDILERARNRPIINVEEDSVTVGQMIQFLARRLTMEDRPVALRRMLSHTKSERALIAMFLALLELVRLQAILLRQDRQFSEIFIKKNTGFDALMNQGLAEARDDWR
jgi:segregation and condensation protein A